MSDSERFSERFRESKFIQPVVGVIIATGLIVYSAKSVEKQAASYHPQPAPINRELLPPLDPGKLY